MAFYSIQVTLYAHLSYDIITSSTAYFITKEKYDEKLSSPNMRKNVLPLVLVVFAASVLSGCITAAAAGAGAAGGYEFNKHYKVKKKKQSI